MKKIIIYSLLGLLFITCGTTRRSLKSFSKQKYTTYAHSPRKYNKSNSIIHPSQGLYTSLNHHNDFELSIQINTDLLYKPKLKTVLPKSKHSHFPKSSYQYNDKKVIIQKQDISTSISLNDIEGQPEEKPISTLQLILACLFILLPLYPVSVALVGNPRDLKINLFLFLTSIFLLIFSSLILFGVWPIYTSNMSIFIYLLAYLFFKIGLIGYYGTIAHAIVILIRKGFLKKN